MFVTFFLILLFTFNPKLFKTMEDKLKTINKNEKNYGNG